MHSRGHLPEGGSVRIDQHDDGTALTRIDEYAALLRVRTLQREAQLDSRLFDPAEAIS